MALHVGHNCNPWEDCDVCGAEIEPPYSQRTDVCAMCRQGFTLCRCRHQLRERMENMAKLIGAYETVDHREVNGWTVTLFRNLSHDGTQPHGSFSATVREGVSEDVLSFYGETREDVEREVLHIVGVSPLDAARPEDGEVRRRKVCPRRHRRAACGLGEEAMTRDRLEEAFLRLRAAADADEYVPMEDVIETVLDRLAHAEDVQNGDDAASRIAERVMREVRKDFEGVVESLQEKLNEKTRGLEMANARLRDTLHDIREWSKPEHVLRFDDGDVALADYITNALEKRKP